MRPIKPVEPAYYKVIDPNFEIELLSLDEDKKIQREKIKISEALEFLSKENWDDIRARGADKSDDDKKKLARKARLECSLNGFYRRSMKDLLDRFGDVCAYCGVRIQASAHVEHVKPKAVFPQEMFVWKNLLPACRDCNSAKGSRPTEKNDDKYDKYVWPQKDFRPGMIQESLRPCRFRADGEDHFEPVDRGGPIDLGTEIEVMLTRTDNREMVYRETFLAGQPDVETADPPGDPMDVEPDGTGKRKRKRPRSDEATEDPWAPFFAFSAPAAGSEEAGNTVDHLFVLNRFTSSEKVSDRRAVARAKVWMQARHVVRLLKAQKTSQPSDKAKEALHCQMKQVIKQTGFWSVWYQMFMTTGAFYLEDYSVQAEFVDFLKSNAFPGTDTGRIP